MLEDSERHNLTAFVPKCAGPLGHDGKSRAYLYEAILTICHKIGS